MGKHVQIDYIWRIAFDLRRSKEWKSIVIVYRFCLFMVYIHCETRIQPWAVLDLNSSSHQNSICPPFMWLCNNAVNLYSLYKIIVGGIQSDISSRWTLRVQSNKATAIL